MEMNCLVLFFFFFFPGNQKGLLLRKPQSEFEISIYIDVCLVFVFVCWVSDCLGLGQCE